MRPVLVLLTALAGTEPIAAAQSIAPEPETPRVTIRLHAGPNVFVEGRDADLSGGWIRIGLAFHFGRTR